MNKKLTTLVLSIAVLALTSVATQAATPAADAVYVAYLKPMNAAVTGREATGTARFVIHGDDMTIRVHADGLPPKIMHLQHFHGFKDGSAASCPTAATDTNGDGVVDLIETHAVSGITMVPFTTDPVSMTIVTDTYPKADADGSYDYKETVNVADLKAAFAKAFDDQELNLENRVVYVHGVMDDTVLPDSTASLGDIPAHITLPIACGRITRLDND